MDGFIGFIRAVGPGRLVTIGLVTAGLIAFFFFITMRLAQPQMAMLYSDLELSDSATITERLTALGIPYDLKGDGRTIFVPQDQVANMRVSLAGEGLGGSIIGWEIFDKTDSLGTTSFVQNINRLRAIEGELSRTISSINAVTSARVHIVMPERELFRAEARKPSASMVLKTSHGGLSSGQVSAIQHLVAAAVPNLDPQSISIIDQNGTLLARGGQSEEETFYASTLEERRTGKENRLKSQIETLLEQTVGFGRVRAEVSVEMDLNRITTSTEFYDPDSQVVRSSNTREESSRNQDGGDGAVSVTANLPGNGTTSTSTDTATTSTTEETVNFEISKTITTKIHEGGNIQRISVGVLVDGRYEEDEDGNHTYIPRSEQELASLQALVQSAIGFDQARGDTVQIVNLQFAEIFEGEEAEPPFEIMGLSKDDLARLLEILVFGVVSVLVLFLLVKPLMMRLISSIPEGGRPAEMQQLAGAGGPVAAIPPPEIYGITPELAAAAAEGDESAVSALTKAQEAATIPKASMGIETQIDVATVEGRVQDSALKKVGDIVTRHPEESAAIVRQWLYSD